MVVDNRLLQLARYDDSGEDVIDMGAPRRRPSQARRRQTGDKIAGANNVHVIANPKWNDPFAAFEDRFDLGGSQKERPHHRPGRRHASALYTPNPRLYPPAYLPACSKSSQTPKNKLGGKKRAQQRPRGAESLTRVKRRKRKARRIVPNPRLYKAPQPRLVPQPPPLRPCAAWAPPPQSAPQETASQIALRLSQRTIIPFRQLLPPGSKQQLKGKQRLKSSLKEELDATRDKLWNLETPPDNSISTPPRDKAQTNKNSSDGLGVSPRSKTKSAKSRPANSGSARDKTRTAKHRPGNAQDAILQDSLIKTEVEKIKDIPSIDLPNLALPSTENYVSPAPQRYYPRSQHFRLRTLDSNSSSSEPPPAARVDKPTFKLSTAYQPQSGRRHRPPALAEPAMTASPHSSITPEDISDGNDSLSSAPSEYLAEFLSAIMSRQYAEALKYCKLILHYEPQNATARGFYPLLRYKLGQAPRPVIRGAKQDTKVLGSSNSEGSSSGGGADATRTGTQEGVEDLEEASDSEDESVASLSLDSSGKSSRSDSPAARGTDSASEGSAEPLGVTGADVTNNAARWLADDNGNPHTQHGKHNTQGDDEDDVENDNAAGGDHKLLLKDPQLRQLRAQFACSIK